MHVYEHVDTMAHVKNNFWASVLSFSYRPWKQTLRLSELLNKHFYLLSYLTSSEYNNYHHQEKQFPFYRNMEIEVAPSFAIFITSTVFPLSHNFSQEVENNRLS